MKKYLSRLTLALVVALVMSLGVAIPAMAATALTPVQVGLTKEINMPAGTTTPASTFSFTFDQLIPATTGAGWVIGNTAPAASLVSPRTIDFAADAPNVDQWWSGAPGSTDRHGNILAGATWPHAGTFTFLVRETANTNPTIATNALETLNYDDSAFILRVQVSNCPENGLVPTVAVLTEAEPGTDGRWIMVDGKLRYQPGTPGTPPTESVVNPSDMRFVNSFVRTQGPTNGLDPDNAALAVTKTIADDANFIQANLDTLFDFTLTLTAYQRAAVPGVPGSDGPPPVLATPAIPGLGLPYTAIPDGMIPVIWDTAANAAVTDLSGRDAVVVTRAADGATATVTFQLKHGEQLLIPHLPAGTTWAAVEAAHSDFAPRAEVTVGGGATVTGGSSALVPGPLATDFQAVNTELTTGNRVLTDTGANTGDFVNRYNWSPLTGLVISSMPILVALIGATLILAMMVASRSRQRIEQVPAF